MTHDMKCPPRPRIHKSAGSLVPGARNTSTETLRDTFRLRFQWRSLANVREGPPRTRFLLKSKRFRYSANWGKGSLRLGLPSRRAPEPASHGAAIFTGHGESVASQLLAAIAPSGRAAGRCARGGTCGIRGTRWRSCADLRAAAHGWEAGIDHPELLGLGHQQPFGGAVWLAGRAPNLRSLAWSRWATTSCR